MSSRPRPTYRGVRHQYKRGFSDRTSSGSDQFITGDSTPRDSANPGAFNTRPPPRPFNYRLSYPPPPPPPFSNPPRPQFNAPPPSFKNRPPQFNYPPPPFNQNQSLRPQAFIQNQQVRRRPQKPLDYRNWEYARTRPPPDCERFTVLSYNILADYLAIDHRSKLYYHIPRLMLDWEWRKKNIFFELGLWSADVLCFQEVDRFQDLEEELKVRGYCGVWKMRTGNPVDGCATFWRFSRFKLLHEESIEFNKLGLRDNVAQICVLESVDQKDKRYKSAIPTSCSSAGSSKVVICNIHVLYNPRRGEIKLGQVRNLLNRAYAVSKLWDDAPVVLCGDFNCTPKSPLYNFISEQKLDLSELPRDKLSGQASAEIRAPRPFPNLRTQSVDTPTMVDNMKDVVKSEPPEVDSHQEDVLHSSFIRTGHGEDLDVTSNATHGSSSENRKSNLHDESETLNCEKVICDDSYTVAKTLHEPGSTLNMDLTTSTSIDIILDEKMENVSSNKIVTEAETLDEDDTSFSSELHNIDVANPGSQQLHPPSDGVLDYNNPDMDFNPVDVERPTYDPSAWTPMEVETATGSSDCTLVEHPLKLTSTYSEAEDSSGTRDSNGEPLVTSYNRCFLGTVDYIWHSEGLQTVKVLAPIPKHAMQWTPGFPTKKWGSDHIALVSEVAFAKDMTNQDEAR